MRSLSIQFCAVMAGLPGTRKGRPINAELIARALDGETLIHKDICAEIHGMTMPVLWNGAFEPVQKAIDELHPNLVLALGTDGRASAMRPEPFGVNWRKGCDAGDNPEVYSPILEGDEIWLRGTLPYDAMTRAMLDAGVPAQTGALSSADADAPLPFKSTTGMYLCNYMTYRLVSSAAKPAYARASCTFPRSRNTPAVIESACLTPRRRTRSAPACSLRPLPPCRLK